MDPIDPNPSNPPSPPPGVVADAELGRLNALADQLRQRIADVVLGHDDAVDFLLATYVAGGHALLEGVPGLGKTLLARAFSASLGLELQRVQFTPDLMPADLLGTNIFDRQQGDFRLVKGPIFTQVLMADEINRTPPKTQSALLEAMQERQVSIDGDTLLLDPSFFVVATQNPLEFEGVYPLPEAQLDRFLLRISLDLPQREAEREIYARAVTGRLTGWSGGPQLPSPVISPQDAAALRLGSTRIHVESSILDYLVELSSAVRDSRHVDLGPSPRGALALLETARGLALLEGRSAVIPDDLKALLAPCWGHRILMAAESELEGYSPGRVLAEVADRVEVPR
ncbi:MAG: MoxR family ATPase [Acidobacteriota bacterium]